MGFKHRSGVLDRTILFTCLWRKLRKLRARCSWRDEQVRKWVYGVSGWRCGGCFEVRQMLIWFLNSRGGVGWAWKDDGYEIKVEGERCMGDSAGMMPRGCDVARGELYQSRGEGCKNEVSIILGYRFSRDLHSSERRVGVDQFLEIALSADSNERTATGADAGDLAALETFAREQRGLGAFDAEEVVARTTLLAMKFLAAAMSTAMGRRYRCARGHSQVLKTRGVIYFGFRLNWRSR